MKAVLFSFTRQASLLSLTVQQSFLEEGISCTNYTIKKYAAVPNLLPLPAPLKEVVAEHFQKDTVLIFISACGIAVRSIAPFLKDKTKDPCVLVIDEKGQFVISLLSGHLGGGNLQAEKAASAIGATPVISTATDLNNRFSVDIFAKNNHLAISDRKIAKHISANILDGLPIGMDGILPDGNIPEGLTGTRNSVPPIGFSVSPFYQNKPFKETLFLIPKQIVLGIGCKKNTDIQALREFVNEILEEHSIFPEAIAAIASIDLKKEEPALLALSKELSVPFATYDARTLQKVKGQFTSSEFVRKTTGVDNVCERAALCYSHADSLYLRKTARNGMTIAISLLSFACHF
ncbi:cobalt-precorrin 5A hydrolase [[Clostridium] polysaccharolyticum]|uniref:Cobalt-precorrin 5A hydrolase n=1 Tax=[Clostridium] polysaccharolyticum TaxID=29364 RepID=A0A1H9Y464_9FIRM|nr:cobalt-precorrin 5A hydrolase [[Clostridium] polysaccharolyticum]SES63655.1 cobalt-precorrin 5A hydrolase [[Clostridium] polysaccharolyticum]